MKAQVIEQRTMREALRILLTLRHLPWFVKEGFRVWNARRVVVGRSFTRLLIPERDLSVAILGLVVAMIEKVSNLALCYVDLKRNLIEIMEVTT